MPEATYGRGELNAAEVEKIIQDVLNPSFTDESFDRDLSLAGISRDDLRSAEVSVTERGAGLGGVGEALVIAVLVKASEKLIDEVIVPYIHRRYGDNAIGAKRD